MLRRAFDKFLDQLGQLSRAQLGRAADRLGVHRNTRQGVPLNTSTPLIYSPGSPNFKDSTRFVDAKIGWKWRPDVEFFVEGRNLGNATTSNSQGPHAPLSNGVPNLLDYAYAGRRIMAGVQFRTM